MSTTTTCQELGLRRAAVLGAGTMGAGIAQVLSQAGVTTRLFDINQPAIDAGLARITQMLEKGVARGKLSVQQQSDCLAKLSGELILEEAVADCQLVIEAAPEKVSIKVDLFERIAAVVDVDCVIASNTSSLSISDLANACSAPERFIGLHFFNPPPLIKLLEIVQGELTSEQVVAKCRELGSAWGKQAIVVKDSPGFASSRLGLAIGLEAMRMVDEGVASPEDIDAAMKLGYGFPMGPLELTDLIGLDVRLDIAKYLATTLDSERFAVPSGLAKRVAEGHLGKKSGQGYYTWD